MSSRTGSPPLAASGVKKKPRVEKAEGSRLPTVRVIWFILVHFTMLSRSKFKHKKTYVDTSLCTFGGLQIIVNNLNISIIVEKGICKESIREVHSKSASTLHKFSRVMLCRIGTGRLSENLCKPTPLPSTTITIFGLVLLSPWQHHHQRH